MVAAIDDPVGKILKRIVRFDTHRDLMLKKMICMLIGAYDIHKKRDGSVEVFRYLCDFREQFRIVPNVSAVEILPGIRIALGII